MSSSEIEHEDRSLSPGVGMEKILLQLGGFCAFGAFGPCEYYQFKEFSEVGQMLTMFS